MLSFLENFISVDFWARLTEVGFGTGGRVSRLFDNETALWNTSWISASALSLKILLTALLSLRIGSALPSSAIGKSCPFKLV